MRIVDDVAACCVGVLRAPYWHTHTRDEKKPRATKPRAVVFGSHDCICDAVRNRTAVRALPKR